MRQVYAKILVHAHDKPGAVRTVGQAGAAVHVGITHELSRKLYHIGSGAACRVRISLAAFLNFTAGCRIFGSFLFSRSLRRLSRLFLLGQSGLLLGYRLGLHKLRGKGNVIQRNITVTFLDVYLNPAVQLLRDNQFILDRNQTENCFLQTGLLAHLQGRSRNGRDTGSHFLRIIDGFVTGHTIFTLHISLYRAGTDLIPAVLLLDIAADGLIVKFADDLAILAGDITHIHIIIHSGNHQILKALFLLRQTAARRRLQILCVALTDHNCIRNLLFRRLAHLIRCAGKIGKPAHLDASDTDTFIFKL